MASKVVTLVVHPTDDSLVWSGEEWIKDKFRAECVVDGKSYPENSRRQRWQFSASRYDVNAIPLSPPVAP